jgi:hypothetical protein
MAKELTWFTDRIMGTVQCTLPGGEIKTIEIVNEKDAKHYHDMQARGYKFEPKLTVYKAPKSICESCEG